jgi:uncharacterized protein (DUF1800 family)
MTTRLLLTCVLLLALTPLLACLPARAADDDPNDPALKRAGQPKISQKDLIRIRIAELESGAINDSMKTPETVVLTGPPLSEHEKVVHVLNRCSFGWRPGEIDAVEKAGGWSKWVDQQLAPDKIDDSKLDALVAKRYPWLTRTMRDLAGEFPRGGEQDKLRKDFREMVLLRAVMSNRQFKEVMCEFWRNHFCIDTPDGSDTARAYTAPDYEEKVIRANVFGTFKQMLFASATHPAMLEYLDNFKSRANNWNENYAREVMELHTLGADRGYNETDVLELAKVLTGWTYDKSYHFEFNKEWQQPGVKHWRGMTIPAGYAGGQQALSALASDTRCAEFISFKLCRYLVNDNPPQSLVKKVSSVFLSSGGDLPKVYAAILKSDEFMQRYNYRSKFKTPFEFIVSALRTTDATVEDGGATINTLTHMGEPLYNCKDPTGYYDQAEAWRDAGVLTGRWDYAWKLLHGAVPGVTVSSDFIKSYSGLEGKALHDRLVETLIGSDIGTRTLEVLRKTTDLPEMISIVMGSPSFQQQ